MENDFVCICGHYEKKETIPYICRCGRLGNASYYPTDYITDRINFIKHSNKRDPYYEEQAQRIDRCLEIENARFGTYKTR